MKIEEVRRIAIRVPELRKKELRSKLTFAEQQELDSMIAKSAEEYPDRTEQQYAETVRLTAIRNFTFNDITRKTSLLQKMFKQENLQEYELNVLDEAEDVAAYDLHFTFALKVRQLMEDVGLGLDWPKMLPVDDAMSYTDIMEEDDKEWFESFPNPAWCSGKLLEAYNLEEKVNTYGKEMVQVIQWLRTYWENGYQIYADIDPDDNDDEWD